MKFFLFGTTLLISTALVLCDHSPVTESEKEFELEFLKEYKDKEEEAVAAAELKKEEKQINQENKLYDEGKANFYEKLNAESDVPKDEFEKTREGYISANPERGLGYFVIPESEWYTDEDLLSLYERQEEAPPEWNSVNKNLVTSAKNQAQCGSCSAFSATAVHETCMLMAGAKMEGLDISEQYLIDCGYDLNDYRYGCKGADAGRYLKYYSQSMDGSSPHEYDYRYLNKNPKLVCPKDIQPRNFGAKVASAKNDYFCTEEKLKTLITKYGAVSVSIYASEESFKNYAGGIYDKCKSSDVNHAVTAVGYGTENGVDYWLIKNSWGEDWGMKGYFKLKRGVGMCGIGKLCFTTVCEQTSGPLSPIPSIPPTSDCKVDGFDMTGEFTTDFKGKEVTIECTDGKCKAKKGGFNSPNACMAICGELSCIP